LRSAQRWLSPKVQEVPGALAAEAPVQARVPGAQVVAAPVLRAEPLVMAAEVAQAPVQVPQAPVQVPQAQGDHHPQPSAHPVTPPT
jgi:hypothetical protein